MRYFRNHIARFVAFIIALQILNMSIDAPAAQMDVKKGTEDTFNYIDTYVEYIAEVILKFENAIPESKDRQQKELQQHKQYDVVFNKLTTSIISIFIDVSKKHPRRLADTYAFQFVKEFNPPPPRA